jgi:1,4-dihydroxy-2-naphthoyl-CoA hydrolase
MAEGPSGAVTEFSEPTSERALASEAEAIVVSGPTSERALASEAEAGASDRFRGWTGVLGDRLGIEIVEASPERIVGTMPVDGNTQPFGLLHGGASCALAESLGSVGASMHAALSFGGTAVGIEISASHHRSARAGRVTGVATPLYLGGSVATYEVVITDEAGERVCTARLTCRLRRG